MISSEIEEMVNLSDRVIVLHNGAIVAETDQINSNQLMSMALGEGGEKNEQSNCG